MWNVKKQKWIFSLIIQSEPPFLSLSTLIAPLSPHHFGLLQVWRGNSFFVYTCSEFTLNIVKWLETCISSISLLLGKHFFPCFGGLCSLSGACSHVLWLCQFVLHYISLSSLKWSWLETELKTNPLWGWIRAPGTFLCNITKHHSCCRLEGPTVDLLHVWYT